ncbi:MAG: VWA domain-containing protein [Bacteroidota bacterium]
MELNEVLEDKAWRWRMLLGKEADPEEQLPLTGELLSKDELLGQLYSAQRRGGLGSSNPSVNRWLGDIRRYFSKSVVQVLQKDAMDRLGIDRLLLEPELLELAQPDVHLVATLLSLKKVIPSKTKATARVVVEQVVNELMQRLEMPMHKALNGRSRKQGRTLNPKLPEINWIRTIQKNLKHYQPSEGFLIAEQLIGYERKSEQLDQVIILADQSGSMAASIVYVSVFAAVLASIPAIDTRLVLFDTEIADLSDQLDDPVDLLFGAQLGGGTDIQKAVAYGQQQIDRPNDTLCILITDLFEGADPQILKARLLRMKESGVHLMVLLALDDQGKPSFNRDIANFLASLQIPCFACSPDQFPDLLAHAMAKKDIFHWMNTQDIPPLTV